MTQIILLNPQWLILTPNNEHVEEILVHTYIRHNNPTMI